jgi:lactoylglutathione lyase
MFSKVDYVMVNVSDMARSVKFYRDTLGIALKFESPGWTEMQTGTTTLALHHVPPSGGAGAPKGEPAAGTCSIGFSVKSVDAAFAELKSRGARFVMPPTERKDEGIRLAVCIDPDGLAISFAEPLAKGA